jgi:hypothetical protein
MGLLQKIYNDRAVVEEITQKALEKGRETVRGLAEDFTKIQDAYRAAGIPLIVTTTKDNVADKAKPSLAVRISGFPEGPHKVNILDFRIAAFPMPADGPGEASWAPYFDVSFDADGRHEPHNSWTALNGTYLSGAMGKFVDQIARAAGGVGPEQVFALAKAMGAPEQGNAPQAAQPPYARSLSGPKRE